ncbi:hypothetical protein [uncultured Eudoraea sp.]|uniref:hypothetical protein n=1 Tax=uncultured Eudoraea sp. TaxID=1035614 RepID=UPI002603FF3E|nr:hypothetical protein [uncultured Eudoraea sp.]
MAILKKLPYWVAFFVFGVKLTGSIIFDKEYSLYISLFNKFLKGFVLMKLNNYCSILLFFIFFTSVGQTVDCTLGIGGKDTETIIKVFQLSEEQLVQMEGWIEELNKSNELIEEQIDVLLDKHPQSNEEELQVLAEKFKPLRAQIIANSRICDQKLVGILNENQYQRYISLCFEAVRRPLKGLTSKEDSAPE